MKQNTTNSAFISAIDNMMLVCDEQLTFEQVKNYFVAETTARELSELVLKSVWKSVLKNLNGYGLAISAGQAGGKLMSNALFSTDENLELYYSLNALAEYEDAMKAALNIAEKKYINNPTDENAVAFNEAYKLLLQTHILGVEAAKKVVVFENESGLVNSLITLLTKDDYGKAIADLDELKAGMTKTLSTLYGNVYNLYIKQYGEEAEALGLLPKILPTDEEYNSAYSFLSNFSSDAKGVTFSKDYTLTEDRIIYGNVLLTGGTLNLNGHKLTVVGNLTQTGGTINVGTGTFATNGNYDIMMTDSTGGFDAGNGITKIHGDFNVKSDNKSHDFVTLIMNQENAYLLVEGDMYLSQAPKNNDISAGTLELKGDFYEDYVYYLGQFAAKGTHKVILSGNKEQNIYFRDIQNSYFNFLESLNPKTKFNSYAGIKQLTGNSMFDTLYLNNCMINNIKICVQGNLYCADNIEINNSEIIVYGDMDITKSTSSNIEINTGILDIKGNLKQTKGFIYLNDGYLYVGKTYNLIMTDSKGGLDLGNGTIKIHGDFNVKSDSKSHDFVTLIMNQENAYLLVEGDMYLSQAPKNNDISAGTLELKGDFYEDYVYYLGQFAAKSTHKVILSGDEEQNIYFRDNVNSYFNTLINRNPNGVVLTKVKYNKYQIEYQVFDVSFVTNCEEVIESTKITYGQLLEKPQTPDNSGLDFIGWYVDETLTTPYDFGAEVRKDLVLYAKWSDELFAFTEATYSIENNTIFASVDIADELQEKNGIVIIAIYNGDSFVHVYFTEAIPTVNHTFNNLDDIENSYTIKAFYWSDFETLMPICDALEKEV